jgi:Uma2 family endonuclease
MRAVSKSPPPRPATYQDLRALPEDVVGEIIDGELIATPRPAFQHVTAQSELLVALGREFGGDNRGGPGGWRIVVEPELHIAGQVLVPDLAGWRRERMPTPPAVPFIELAPDWVCEILSPSTAALDRTRKIHHYAHAAVGHLWLLDPLPQTVEVYRLEPGGWKLVTSVAGAVKVRSEPFEDVELDLARIWGG